MLKPNSLNKKKQIIIQCTSTEEMYHKKLVLKDKFTQLELGLAPTKKDFFNGKIKIIDSHEARNSKDKAIKKWFKKCRKFDGPCCLYVIFDEDCFIDATVCPIIFVEEVEEEEEKKEEK